MLAVLKGLRALTRDEPPKEPWRSRPTMVSPPGVVAVALAEEPLGVADDCEGVFITLVGMTRTVEGVEGERTWVAAAGGDEGANDIVREGRKGAGRGSERTRDAFQH